MTVTTPVDLELVSIAVDDLHPADDNPRHDLGDLTELAASIASIGILQPLVVVERHVGGGYTIVAGHRRHAAARIAGVETVPCIVRQLGHEERNLAMLVENLQRQDLDPLDEAQGFLTLTELGLSQRQIAERVGCNQSHVSRRLKLMDLDLDLVELVRDDKLPLRLAEDLANEHDQDVINALVRKAEKGPLGSYDIEQARAAEARKKLTAEGKATGLPELTDTWRGTAVDSAEEATHWYRSYDSTAGGYVVAFRNVPPKATPEQEQAATDNRRAEDEKRAAQLQRAAERGIERRRLAAAHLDDLFDWAVREAITEGVYAPDCQPDVVLQLLGVDAGDAEESDVLDELIDGAPYRVHMRVLAAMAVDQIEQQIGRTYASAGSAGPYLDQLNRWGWPLDEYEQGLCDRWRGDAPGIEPSDGEVSLEDTPDDELPGMWERADFEGGATDNEQFAAVDAEPPDVDDLGFFDPIDPPKRPWATYDGNDEALICKMVKNFTVPAAVHEVIAYEAANLNRPAVIEQCEATLAKLAS